VKNIIATPGKIQLPESLLAEATSQLNHPSYH